MINNLTKKSVKDASNSRPTREDPERFKRKIAKAKERRATLVLGIIMATFIGCWLPFFSIYLVVSFAHLYFPPMAFAVFFWFGYVNSALNPIIYTIFNRDFKNAFHKIVFGRKNTFYS
jgi:adrenergic receptor alpha-2A/adrenergic receptor alpha-2C